MLKQTGSVADYHSQFEKLAHGILLYNTVYDDVYFVTKFLAGLKEEIRAPIALHRPRDVDTASALVLLQEEELALTKIKPVGRGFTKGFDHAGPHKAAEKTPQSDSEDKLACLKQFR